MSGDGDTEIQVLRGLVALIETLTEDQDSAGPRLSRGPVQEGVMTTEEWARRVLARGSGEGGG